MPAKENQTKNTPGTTGATKKAKKSGGKTVYNVFGIVILAIIAVSFVVGPIIGSLFDAPMSSNVYGTWNGEEIRYDTYFYNMRQQVGDEFRSRNQLTGDPNYDAFQVMREAFDRTALRLAMIDTANQNDLIITDNLIDRTLSEAGPYIVDGEFDEAVWNNTSNSQRHQNRLDMKNNLLHQKVMTYFYSTNQYSDAEMDFFKQMGAQQRQFDVVAFELSSFPDENVRSYGQENSNKFQTIELSRIFVSKENKSRIDDLHTELLADPSTFNDLAMQNSADSFAADGGKMGVRVYHTLEGQFSSEDLDTLFGLSQNEISQVIELNDGYAIYRVDTSAGSADFSDAQTIAEVRNYMSRNDRGIMEDFLTDQAADFISKAAAGSLTEAAVEANKSIYTTNYFPINYNTEYLFDSISVEGNPAILNGAANKASFFEKAFALKENELSEPVIIGDNVIVLRLAGEKTVDTEELVNINSYFGYFVQSYQQEALKKSFMESELFEDNFYNAFRANFLNG